MSSSGMGDSHTVASGTSERSHTARRSSWRTSRLSTLTEAEMSIFCDVWAQARQRQIALHEACALGEERESVLLRFLRANQFNATKTLQVGPRPITGPYPSHA